MDVIVVPHDPAWTAAFDREASRIREALNDGEIEVHHIGSTSIRAIFAKPIIDILLLVQDHGWLDARVSSIGSLGYEAMGKFGIAGRRYFRKNDANGVRTHHVHAFEKGNAGAGRHFAFRDYMNAHPEVAQEYSLLKQR